jgi:hypothetical protein
MGGVVKETKLSRHEAYNPTYNDTFHYLVRNDLTTLLLKVVVIDGRVVKNPKRLGRFSHLENN